MSILVAYNLKKYRKLNNLTQQQLSDNIKTISKPAIALYEGNRRTPDYDTQEKLCNYLNISMSVLNGQNEVDYFVKLNRNYLVQYNISSNEYQYIYRQVINLLNDRHFRYNGSLEDKDIKEFKKFLESNFKEIKNNISNEFCSNEKKDILIRCYEYIMNSFIGLNMLVREKKTFEIEELITEDFFKSNNKEVNADFLKTFIELSTTYIKIIDTLKEIDIFLNSGIPMYFKDTKNIFDYILPNKSNTQEILTAIKVNDDFMTPRFEKNDVVIAKQCKDYKTGQYVAISNENNELLLGKLKIDKDVIILQPLNIAHSPIILNSKVCKILGKIIEVKYAN